MSGETADFSLSGGPKPTDAHFTLPRENYTRMNRTLLRLCCPKEWFEEEIDDDELWSKAVWEPTLSEVIDSLK